jgi:hypothetical protein
MALDGQEGREEPKPGQVASATILVESMHSSNSIAALAVVQLAMDGAPSQAESFRRN